MFGLGLGDRLRDRPRGPRVDWPRIAPYGLTLVATILLGWALSQIG